VSIIKEEEKGEAQLNGKSLSPPAGGVFHHFAHRARSNFIYGGVSADLKKGWAGARQPIAKTEIKGTTENNSHCEYGDNF
jgi:hypothetical protein